MTCSEIRHILESCGPNHSALSGDGDSRIAFDHLDMCHECDDFFQSLLLLDQRLGVEFRDVAIPDGLEHRILAQLSPSHAKQQHAAEPLEVLKDENPGRPMQESWGYGASMATAAALLISAGLYYFVLCGESQRLVVESQELSVVADFVLSLDHEDSAELNEVERLDYYRPTSRASNGFRLEKQFWANKLFLKDRALTVAVYEFRVNRDARIHVVAIPKTAASVTDINTLRSFHTTRDVTLFCWEDERATYVAAVDTAAVPAWRRRMQPVLTKSCPNSMGTVRRIS